MGYTHYWRRPQSLDPVKFEQFATDCKAIFKEARDLNIKLANGMGDLGRGPKALAWEVSFNGEQPNDYETVLIKQQTEIRKWDDPDENGNFFEFCKTGRRPYDPIVTAVLIALKHHFPEVEISSDGGPEGFDEGRGICEKLFNYGKAELIDL